MKPVVGFGSAIMILDVKDFDDWMRQIEFNRDTNLDDFEDIFVLAQYMVSLYQEFDREVTWDRNDFAFVKGINGGAETDSSV